MKTKLLFTLALALIAGIATSQSLVLSHEGETLEPNAELTVEGSATAVEIIVELEVTNNGSSTIDVLCERFELDLVPGSSSALCWGGLCYPPWTNVSAYHTTIGPGVTIENDFSGHYYPDGNAGVSTIAFTFFDMNNVNDSVMVTILFDGLTTGVNENRFDALEVYPNPADDYINLDLNVSDAGGEVSFELIDVTGTVVRQAVSSSSKVRVSTSDLADGIYVYRAMVNEQLISSEKIVIRH